jgi:hypothetical protein
MWICNALESLSVWLCVVFVDAAHQNRRGERRGKRERQGSVSTWEKESMATTNQTGSKEIYAG